MVLKSGSDCLGKFPIHPACMANLTALRNRLESGTACQLCYKNFDRINRRRRGQNKTKQTPKFISISETSTCLQKHIFAIAISRTEVFQNESPGNHRFTEKSGFHICRGCYTTCWNYFKNLSFSHETSDYFSYFRLASSPDQVGLSQDLSNVGPFEDNLNAGPSQDPSSNDMMVERLSQEIEQLGHAGSHEPDSIEDPDSDIEFDFHPPPQRPGDDDIPDNNDGSSSSQSSSSDSQPTFRSLTYFKTKNKYFSIIDCSSIDTNKCVLCGASPSAIEEAILLNTELVYDFIDFFKIGLKNWSELNFVCDTCHPTSETISDSSLELVKIKSPPKKINKFVVQKGLSEVDIISFHETRS